MVRFSGEAEGRCASSRICRSSLSLILKLLQTRRHSLLTHRDVSFQSNKGGENRVLSSLQEGLALWEALAADVVSAG